MFPIFFKEEKVSALPQIYRRSAEAILESLAGCRPRLSPGLMVSG
jgi:hypothetical protein